MLDIHELRAHRLGITFRRQGRRDPFRFISNNLLLVALYAITRPRVPAKTPRVVAAPATPVVNAIRGERWGNDQIGERSR